MSDQQQEPQGQAPETQQQTKAPEQKPLGESIRAKLLGISATQPKPEKKEETPAATPQADPAKESKSADPTPAPAPEPAQEKPKKTKAPAKIIAAPEPPIGEVVAKAATEAAVAAVKATQPKPAPVPEPEIPKDIQRKLDYYKEMEELDPKYKGLAQKVVEFSKKGGIEEQYIAQWKKANPGKQFDADDEEHEDFYSTNAPDYDEQDFETVREQVIERRAVEKAKKAMEPELQKQRLREVEKEVEPMLAQASYSIAAGALGAISEELVKIASEKGDAGLEEADPLALQVASQVIPAYEPVAHEAIRLFSNLAKLDEDNPVHQQVNRIALELDSAIGQVDRDQAVKPVVKNGRVVGYLQFATYAEWQAMSPAQRKNHWIVGQDEVLARIAAVAKHETKTRYDRIVAAASKTLGAKTGQKKMEAASVKPAQTPTPVATPPPSPTISSSTPSPTPSAGDNAGLTGKRAAFAKALGVMR